MVRVIVFSRLLGRKRCAGDAGHRQAALTPAKRREKRPFGRPWVAIGRRRAALVIGPHPEDGRPHTMDLKAPVLFGEDKYLGVDRLPVPGA